MVLLHTTPGEGFQNVGYYPPNYMKQNGTDPDVVKICPLGVRKLYLSNMCLKWPNATSQTRASHIITDSSRHLLYCQVSKVACTKIKMLWELANTNWTSISTVAAHDHSKMKMAGLQPNSIFKLDNLTLGYTKFIVTRHPLERLISAYNNLLHLNGNGPYYAVEPLIEMYRLEKSGIQGLTFPMFLGAIVNTSFSQYNNDHWIPYTSTCSPCYMNYDYIARTETMKEGPEMAQVLAQLDYNSTVMNSVVNQGTGANAKRTGSFTASDNSITKSDREDTFGKNTKYQTWFKNVPKFILRKVIERYRDDMMLFGYGFNMDDNSLSCGIKYAGGTCC